VAKLSSLRASDSDREQVAERLRYATAEGRLTADELEQRLEILFASRTYGELDALEADLRVGRPRVPVGGWAGAVSGTLVLALLGRLAARRRYSNAAALAGAGHPQVRFPHRPVAGDGLTVVASMVRRTVLERDGEVRLNVETVG
jgi:acyl dehydratase